MRLGHKWPEREPRPKVRKISDEEKEKILKRLSDGIKSSPVLSFLGFRIKTLRGRFYYETSEENDLPDVEIVGRVTPLDNHDNDFLLEALTNRGSWSSVSQGALLKIKNTIAMTDVYTKHLTKKYINAYQPQYPLLSDAK